MKRYLLTGIVTGVISMGGFCFLGSQLALADVAPPNQKSITTCAQLSGIAALPRLTVLSEQTPPDGIHTVTAVKDGDCLTWYKFSTYNIYAVDADYAKTLDLTNYDPSKDAKAYPASLQVAYPSPWVDPGSNLEYQYNEYVVAGVNNTSHQLVLLSAGDKTNLADETATPNFPSGLSAAIGSQVAVNGPAVQTNVFTDVTSNSPYYNALIYLKTNGIVSGYADGSFKPDNTINRAEFAKIVVESAPGYVNNGLCMETFGKADGTYSDMFKDVLTKDNAWYDDDLCFAKTSNWIGGYPDGTFRPDQNINFVEAAKIIANADQLAVPAITGSDPWYKGYVEELASQNAIPVGIAGFSQNITRGEMAEIVYRIKTKNTTLSSQTYADLK
jgi:hypothetical protein